MFKIGEKYIILNLFPFFFNLIFIIDVLELNYVTCISYPLKIRFKLKLIFISSLYCITNIDVINIFLMYAMYAMSMATYVFCSH